MQKIIFKFIISFYMFYNVLFMIQNKSIYTKTILQTHNIKYNIFTTNITEQKKQHLSNRNKNNKTLSITNLINIINKTNNTLLFENAVIMLANKYLINNYINHSENLIRKYSNNFKHITLKKQAINILNKINTIKTLNIKYIGIILPLSGKYSSYGIKTLSSIQLALKCPQYINKNSSQFKQKCTNITLIIINSEGNHIKASNAVKKLVKQYKVSIIFGDIIDKSSQSIAQQSQKYKIPTIILSATSKINNIGSFILNMGLTAKKQTQALAKYAIMTLGIDRFAILYPNNKYGIEMMKYFWKEIYKYGSEIKAIEKYNDKETTFTTYIKKILGTYYLNTKTDYLHCIQKEILIKYNKTKNKIIEKCKNKIKPIINFEALFIPDFSKTISYIVPALINEDVITSKTTLINTINNNQKYLQLLGGSGWNNLFLGKKLKNKLNGAIFVDIYNINNSKFKNNLFVNTFLKLHNTYPSLLEIQAYNAALVIKKIITKNMKTIKCRKNLLNKILQHNKFNGLFFSFNFTQNGESTSNINIFTFNNSKIKNLYK